MKLEWRSQLDPGIFIKENGDGYSSSISRGKAQLAEHVHLEARVAIRRAYYDHDKVCGEEYKASLSIHQTSDVFDLMGFCPSPSLWCSEWSTKILQPSKSDEAAIARARHYVERMANGVDKMIDLSGFGSPLFANSRSMAGRSSLMILAKLNTNPKSTATKGGCFIRALVRS